MENIIRQCIGIDCSKNELAACFSLLAGDFQVVHKATRIFPNTPGGFSQLLKWSRRLANSDKALMHVVEATGVYHERMAYYLHEHQCAISVVLPNRAKHFSLTLKVKTSNDKVASKMLATLGLEKKLDTWQPPYPLFVQLKTLTRERDQMLQERNQIGNQLHALEQSASGGKSSIKRIKVRLRLLEKQIMEIEHELEALVETDENLSERIKNICTIKGIGFLTAVIVIAETNGFHLIRNKKQLVSYAGYDVVEKQSGTSVHSKARISGRGNRRIRKALYFPAFVVVKQYVELRGFYERLEQKHGIKMKAYTAVQRKLLVLIYTLWKKNEAFNPEFTRVVQKNLEQPHMETALTELDLVRS